MTEQARGRHVPFDASWDLPTVIDELVDELTGAIRQVSANGGATSRAIALHVLTGWLRANRELLPQPGKADEAESLISTLFQHAEVDGFRVDLDIGEASAAAHRLAVALGDDFPMMVVWVAAGLDAQFE